MSKLATTYILAGHCPNWTEALTLAQQKMGCAPGSKPPSEDCQEQLPCDVCQFLPEGAWPPAHIVDFPAEAYMGRDPNVLGAVMRDPQRRVACPLDDKTRAEFKSTLCHEKKVLGYDRVNALAKAMVHEALHLCKDVGATGSATTDKSFWDHLTCAVVYGKYSPEAEDVVDLCWEPHD